jgi:hypothetical protein
MLLIMQKTFNNKTIKRALKYSIFQNTCTSRIVKQISSCLRNLKVTFFHRVTFMDFVSIFNKSLFGYILKGMGNGGDKPRKPKKDGKTDRTPGKSSGKSPRGSKYKKSVGGSTIRGSHIN